MTSQQHSKQGGQEICLRCGIDKKDKPYGICVLYGTAEKRHLWGTFRGETQRITLADLERVTYEQTTTNNLHLLRLSKESVVQTYATRSS